MTGSALKARWEIWLLRSYQAERQWILEWTNEERVEARLKGGKFRRKRSIDRKLLFALHEDCIGAPQISR